MYNLIERPLSVLLTICVILTVVSTLCSCNKDFEPVSSWVDPDVYLPKDGGSITATYSDSDAVSNTAYTGVLGKDYTDINFYTYNTYIDSDGGISWSPIAPNTEGGKAILGYQSMGLYDFVLGADKESYAVVCEMAAELPVDVTEHYVGRYGIKDGESAKAWRITLNQNAVWNDGTPINAESYVYSIREFLDPIVHSACAETFIEGQFEIFGAKSYYLGGRVTRTQNYLAGGRYTFKISELSDYKYNGADVYINYKGALDYLNGYSLDDYVTAYGSAFFDLDAYHLLTELDTDMDGTVLLDGRSLGYLVDVITETEYFGESAESAAAYLVYDYTYPRIDFSEVGAVADGKYELVIIFDSPISGAQFNLPYALSHIRLIHKETYEASTVYFNAEGELVPRRSADAVAMESAYCRSAEASMSYGPYILHSYKEGEELRLKRNDRWYGYRDGKHLGQFQTDAIHIRVIGEHADAVAAFSLGEVDRIDLNTTDLNIYGGSDRLFYTPSQYTVGLNFNTDYEALLALGGNQQILAVSEFRGALSLSIDKREFVSVFKPSARPGCGLFGDFYVGNLYTGVAYRESDAAKSSLVNLFGLTWGAGADYPTLDSAYEALSASNLPLSKRLMQAAYDKATTAGIYDGESEIKLGVHLYDSGGIYGEMLKYFNSRLEEACRGTDFEGKVSLTLVADKHYYNTMYEGRAAIILSRFDARATSLFTLIDKLCQDYEYGCKAEDVPLSLTVNGVDYTASLGDWAAWCSGRSIDTLCALGRFDSYSYDTRCEIFAALERAYLEGCSTVTLCYEGEVSLISRKVEIAADRYIYLIGDGGIRYLTFNYTDAQWAQMRFDVTY